MPIYVICDYCIHQTDLVNISNISSFKKKLGIFAANIEIAFTFRIREFTTSANQIPCVFPVFWQNFQIPCVFPDRDFFGTIFPVFPVQWVLGVYIHLYAKGGS